MLGISEMVHCGTLINTPYSVRMYIRGITNPETDNKIPENHSPKWEGGTKSVQ